MKVFMHDHGDLNNENCDIMYCNILVYKIEHNIEAKRLMRLFYQSKTTMYTHSQ